MSIRQQCPIFCCLFVLCSTFCFAQKHQDVTSWTSLQITKNFTKKWALVFTDQIRLDNNASHVKSDLVTLRGDYKFVSWSRASVGTCYTIRNTGIGTSAPSISFFLDNTLSYKTKRLSFDLRLRLQNEHILQSTRPWLYALRTRFQLVYNPKGLKNWQFFLASCELFWGLSPQLKGFYQYRAGVGFNYDASQKVRLTFQYLVQDKPDDTRVVMSHILNLIVHVRIAPKKEKKEKSPDTAP